MSKLLSEINYRAYPKQFSNRCLVDLRLIDRMAELIDGAALNASTFLALQVLCEAVVFHEKIIVQDEAVVGGSQLPEGGGDSALIDLMRTLNKGNVFDKELASSSSAPNILQTEANILSQPSAENVRVDLIHGSHILIEHVPRGFSMISPVEFTSENLDSRIEQSWSPAYIQALQDYDYYYDYSWEDEGPEGFVPPPWELLADCHGIPYISDPFYTLRDIDPTTPTNIGIELYRKLEALNKDYFRKIRKYLGPTYVHIPSILNLVLNDCSQPEDIPAQLVNVREQFQDFRSACTSLETELRTARLFSDQIEIIREIESVYAALVKKVEKTKTRLLLRLFDILKEIDPVHMGMEVLKQVTDYIVEEEGLIKMPGYFDLWKATTNVKPGITNLSRLFGDEVAYDLIDELKELNKTIGSQMTQT